MGCQQGQLKGDRRKCSPNQNGLGIELLVTCALVGECNHGLENLLVLGHRALVEKVLYNVDGSHLRVDFDTSMAFVPTFILRLRPKVDRLQKSIRRGDRRRHWQIGTAEASKLPVLKYQQKICQHMAVDSTTLRLRWVNCFQ